MQNLLQTWWLFSHPCDVTEIILGVNDRARTHTHTQKVA